MSSELARSRKGRQGTELLCERLFRPLAHALVLCLLPLRVPPPAVVVAAGVTGLAGAVELARGHLLVAALLVQLKTVLDNADGQLARLSGRTSAFGRYLDSELDLLVNAALLAALGWFAGAPVLALVAFLVLTGVLSLNFNLERLYRVERGASGEAMPEAEGAATRVLRHVYAVAYGWQDALVERFVAWRLRGFPPAARLAYHDALGVEVLANLGMSTQLAALGLCLTVGRPLAFVWLVLAELPLVVLILVRRELLLRGSAYVEREAL
ncbi:MAG TPA: CDP-alcohol phosphatidyltransferase family protein [Gaiellaceae bacterium]